MTKKTFFIALGLLFVLQGYQNCSGFQKGVEFSNDTSSLDHGDGGLGNEDGLRLINDTADIVYADSDKVDIVIVMDNSGSMKVEQQNMASRFSHFISKLDGLDWRLGIITTDVRSGTEAARDGKLVQFKNTNDFVLTSGMATSYVEASFASTIQMTANGSGSEQGIAATSRLIDRYQDAASENNAIRSLMRADSVLSVIVVSDQNESGSKAVNDGKNLISKIKAVFGNSKRFIFNSIVVKSGDAACKAIDGNEGYGVKYEELSDLTGGIIGTVCAADYAGQLQNIGQATADLVKSLQLKCKPEDTNQDGTPDVTITNNAGAAVTNFTIQGTMAHFSTGLASGTYSLKYYCK